MRGLRSQWIAPLSLAMIVALFGGMVGIASIQLRQDLRDRVIQRYAEIWESVARFQVVKGLEDDLLSGLRFEDTIAYSLMEAQDVDGSLGVQVFGADGTYLAGVPYDLEETALASDRLRRFELGEPWGSWIPSDGGDTSKVELFIPVRSEADDETLALARFLKEGSLVAAEFAAIDSKLAKQASVAFFGGTALVSAVFLWSFRRLRIAKREVELRANRLAAANAELAMVAKTSAVGAVASHLIHGLRNPLAGIRQHIATDGQGLDSEDWDDAKQAARRMQSMINEVVDVLRNESIDDREILDGEELRDYFEAKFRDRAREKGLDFGFRLRGESRLSARKANIVKLIVSNLVDNAMDATPVGGEVEVRIESAENSVDFTVLDTGPGFSEQAMHSLFQASERSSGSGAGIGLAISKQLARHIGSDLELIRSSSSGSVMLLKTPFGT